MTEINDWMFSFFVFSYRCKCQRQGPGVADSFTPSGCLKKWSTFLFSEHRNVTVRFWCSTHFLNVFNCFSCQRAVELLLKHKVEVNARDKFWHTPLHMAAAHWGTSCAKALIPHVCSLDVTDRSGRTPLHHAAHNGHGEVNWRERLKPVYFNRDQVVLGLV